MQEQQRALEDQRRLQQQEVEMKAKKQEPEMIAIQNPVAVVEEVKKPVVEEKKKPKKVKPVEE